MLQTNSYGRSLEATENPPRLVGFKNLRSFQHPEGAKRNDGIRQTFCFSNVFFCCWYLSWNWHGPVNIGGIPKGNFIFQASIFRCKLLVSGKCRCFSISQTPPSWKMNFYLPPHYCGPYKTPGWFFLGTYFSTKKKHVGSFPKRPPRTHQNRRIWWSWPCCSSSRPGKGRKGEEFDRFFWWVLFGF